MEKIYTIQEFFMKIYGLEMDLECWMMKRIRESQKGSLSSPKRRDQESVVIQRSQEFTELEGTFKKLILQMHGNVVDTNTQATGAKMLVKAANL